MNLPVSLRNKFGVVILATGIFVIFAVLLGLVLNTPVDQAALTGAIAGLAISGFEEFYVQANAGRRLRAMHPVASILAYSAVVATIFLLAMHATHLVLGRIEDIASAYARLPTTIPMAFGVAFGAVLVLRVVGFIGARNLFCLLTGRYHRPVIERKVFLFLDIKGSTAIAEELGAIEAAALIGKFLFDVSKPITDHRGDIYLYAGDGLIATWNWDEAMRENTIVRAADAIHAAVRREGKSYLAAFGRVPEFRIGVHGGEVVVSEQGDTRRALGIYGDPINIAARMEQLAKELHEPCVFSAEVVEQLDGHGRGFEFAGEKPVKGISSAIPVYTYRPSTPAKATA